MDGGNSVRATPLGKGSVAFVTRTTDDTPGGGVVPGYREEANDVSTAAGEQPCTIKGLSGGLAAGVLGYVFGFVPSMFRNRSLRSLNVWGAEGMASAKAFAVMSGIYTTVQCISERIRQQDDSVNRIIAGGASGAAVAWRSGPLGALQSGLLLAAVSWIFDFGSGTVPAAKAGALHGGCASGRCSVSVGRVIRASGPGGAEAGRRRAVALRPRLLANPAQVLGTPVVMWMGPLVSRSYFSPPALSLSLQAQ